MTSEHDWRTPTLSTTVDLAVASYRRGLAAMVAGASQARTSLQEAVASDPGFHLAHVGLAAAAVVDGHAFARPPDPPSLTRAERHHVEIEACASKGKEAKDVCALGARFVGCAARSFRLRASRGRALTKSPLRRRTQVAKGTDCKSVMHRFDSDRRLHSPPQRLSSFSSADFRRPSIRRIIVATLQATAHASTAPMPARGTISPNPRLLHAAS